MLSTLLRTLSLLTIISLSAGCARVVVTRGGDGSTTSVNVEPMFSTQSGQPPDIAAQSSSIKQMELATHQRINEQRQKKGLKALEFDASVSKIARDYSRRMSQENFFSHYDAQGKSAADRMKSAGRSFRAVGENLFTSTNAPNPINAAVQGWMKSEGHRANILSKEYSHTGIGIWKDGNTYHFTQIFLRPM